MKRIFLIMSLFLAVVAVTQAQELKRWTITLSGMQSNISGIDKDETKLLPSVSYNINPWLSAGLELGLPLTDNGVYTSTGVELFAGVHSPRLGPFRLSLLPVIGGATIGAYGFSEHHGYSGIDNGPPVPPEMMTEEMREHYRRFREKITGIKYRWYIGIRPVLDCAIGKHWGIRVSYGFWGVRAPRSLNGVLVYENDLVEALHGSIVGLDTSVSFNNALKIGVSYSF